MSGIFIFGVISLAVAAVVISISKFNQHPFLVLTAVAVMVGPVCGIPTERVINTVKSSFGNILASVGIVVPVDTIIGTIPGKTGAALTVASNILRLVSKKNSVLTVGLTGRMTGIPVLCDSGFIILGPVPHALASQSNVLLVAMTTTLSGGLYTVHYLVPPTPGPIAMAGALEADLGLAILIGLLISTPATISVIVYAKKMASKIGIPANPEYTVDELVQKYERLPGTSHSLSPILPPIILITLKSIGDFLNVPFDSGVLEMIVSFTGNPMITLIPGVLLVMTLIPREGKQNALRWVTKGITSSAEILTITGTGGSSGIISQKLPVADALSGSLLGLDVDVLLPLMIATLLKIVMGTSMVAMTAIPAMIALMMGTLGPTSPAVKVLVIMAVGAGSVTVPHVNDSYFWTISQFPDMDTKAAYRYQTGMTAVMDIITIVTVFILSLIFA